ncbi:MAG: hypothetical protein AAF514_13475 [Verrucomicrobiota bacterium]
MLNGVLEKWFKGKEAPDANPDGAAVENEALSAESLAEALPVLSAEELCSLQDKMTPDEMKAHLAALYRRHNRAAGSLDPQLQAEANQMLDAIVEVRHRYLDQKED